MKDLDLNTIWNRSREKARVHYESLGDVEKMAKKQSDSILSKIYRNVLLESVFSVLFIVFLTVAVYQWNSGPAFWIFAAFFAGVVYLSFRVCFRFMRDIRRVNQQSVKQSLQQYIRILGGYIRRQKILIYYITPIAYMVGLVVGALAEGPNDTFIEMLKQIGLGAVIGLPLLFLIMWFFSRKYIQWVYGRPHKNLKKTLEHLDREENNSSGAENGDHA